MDNFTEQNRQRMRYLVLIVEPRGLSYKPGQAVDEALWRSLLPKLKGLRIIAEQPIRPFRPFLLEDDTSFWVDWTQPYLQCFGQYLSTGTDVQIDFDKRAETRALAKQYLPLGFREIRCRRFGDFVFKRGQFSLESGYWDDWNDGDDWNDNSMSSRDADGAWDYSD
jgi:hypothetical protein